MVLLYFGFNWAKSRMPFLTSEVKPKPIVSVSHAFSRAWRPLLQVQHLPRVLIGSFVVYGEIGYIGFCLSALN